MGAYPKFDVKNNLKDSNLFKPLRVGNLDVQNRVVLAPLTRLRAEDGVPPPSAEVYYSQRAQAPGTLLITEASYITEAAGGIEFAPGLYNEAQAASWKKVFAAIHEKGSFAFAQLWALGRQAPAAALEAKGHPYVSASDVPASEGAVRPHALTKDEIKQYIADYVAAAQLAVNAGADGVELHAANGFLPNQFLLESVNNRTDEYGGSIENRTRFTLEVIDALSEAIGAERVALRLSPWSTYGGVDYGLTPITQYSYLVEQLEKRAQDGKRVAYIHLVEPRVQGVDDVTIEFKNDWNQFVGQIWQGPIIRAGNLIPVVHDAANIDDRTLVAVGRYFISNPDLVQLLKEAKPLVRYDRSTFYWNKSEEWPIEKGYTDYPRKDEETVAFDWTAESAQGSQ